MNEMGKQLTANFLNTAVHLHQGLCAERSKDTVFTLRNALFGDLGVGDVLAGDCS
jgi:hypothetical protein